MSGIGETLRAAGMSGREAAAKERLLARCLDALGVRGTDGLTTHFVPGRIEVLGKHTDYAGGRSLLCALERGFIIVARPRPDSIVRVMDARLGETRELPMSPALEIPTADWSTYIAAAVRRIARNFPRARHGADVAFASDLPPSSGMSSSSALSTAIFLALDDVNELASDPMYEAVLDSCEALAGYLATIENGRSFGPLAGDRGVGTFGGSEDHTAILCCRSGMLSRYSFAPVRAEGEVPVPAMYTFVVAYSGVAADKGAAAQNLYNELSLAVERIVELWNAEMGRADCSLAAAVESMPDAASRLRDVLGKVRTGDFTPERLRERLDQFLIESCEIIPRACDALVRDDLEALGALVDRSQRCAEAMLRNQIPETIALTRLARAAGAVAASAFGGGFGGSVWALVESSHAVAFARRWRSSYHDAFADAEAQAEFFLSGAGPAALAI